MKSFNQFHLSLGSISEQICKKIFLPLGVQQSFPYLPLKCVSFLMTGAKAGQPVTHMRSQQQQNPMIQRSNQLTIDKIKSRPFFSFEKPFYSYTSLQGRKDYRNFHFMLTLNGTAATCRPQMLLQQEAAVGLTFKCSRSCGFSSLWRKGRLEQWLISTTTWRTRNMEFRIHWYKMNVFKNT